MGREGFLTSQVFETVSAVCVWFLKACCFRLLSRQETIEVESEHVFKLAAFALQVRKSLFAVFFFVAASLGCHVPHPLQCERGRTKHLKTFVCWGL